MQDIKPCSCIWGSCFPVWDTCSYFYAVFVSKHFPKSGQLFGLISESVSDTHWVNHWKHELFQNKCFILVLFGRVVWKHYDNSIMLQHHTQTDSKRMDVDCASALCGRPGCLTVLDRIFLMLSGEGEVIADDFLSVSHQLRWELCCSWCIAKSAPISRRQWVRYQHNSTAWFHQEDTALSASMDCSSLSLAVVYPSLSVNE